jgi:hypothetical protein
MSPHQSFPLCHKVPDKAQDWSKLRTNCYAMHADAMSISHIGVNLPSTSPSSDCVSGYDTARYYATVPSLHSDRSYWSSEQLHGSPPTCRLGLPPDKNTGCPGLPSLPTGRDDPPDKEITYNCMNGSPGDPPGTVVHQSKQQKNRPFRNPSRGRSIRQGGRMGDNYRRYIICH